jgi:hypothetical protein
MLGWLEPLKQRLVVYGRPRPRHSLTQLSGMVPRKVVWGLKMTMWTRINRSSWYGELKEWGQGFGVQVSRTSKIDAIFKLGLQRSTITILPLFFHTAGYSSPTIMDKTKSKLAAFFDNDDEESPFPVRRTELTFTLFLLPLTTFPTP